jgi:hypothetical protein
MADNTFRCLFEQDDGSFCMEAVAVAGQRCTRHTRVVEVPAIVPIVAAPRAELRDDQRCIAIMKNGQRCHAHRKGRTELCGTHKDWTPIVQCAAHVGRGDRRRQCHNNARPGCTMCGIHKAQEPERPPEAPVPAPEAPAPAIPADVVACRVKIKNYTSKRRGQECGHTRNLMTIPAGVGAQPERCCATHHWGRVNSLRREYLVLDRQSVATVVGEIMGPEQLVDARQAVQTEVFHELQWRTPVTIYSSDPEQARQESLRRAREALASWAANRLRRQNARAADTPRTDLERFTRDAQNVHTREANQLVADANKELEKAEAISGSLKQIKERFEERNFGTPEKRKQVCKDMKRWYSDAKVMRAVGQMEDNDYGYQRLLDKVWGLIQKSKHKEDLEQRLWEEAVDSLGMCTQGHMTRLANVLQGFEEAIEAPKVEIPKGERLQTAMAQIAELPIGERESAARRVFAELEIPEERQGSWLEALEVA